MAAQVVAVTSFVCEANGEQVIVRAGDVYEASHPVAKTAKSLFAVREAHNVTPAPKTRRARSTS